MQMVSNFFEDDILMQGMDRASDDEKEALAYQYTKSRDQDDDLAKSLKIEGFRYQLSLGTKIESIKMNDTGYTVRYSDGDICN